MKIYIDMINCAINITELVLKHKTLPLKNALSTILLNQG